MDKKKLQSEILGSIVTPFGPSIAKVKIPEKIIKILNDHVDEVRNNEKLSKKFDAGKSLIGNVTQEINLSPEIIKESGWLSFLANASRAWIKSSLGKEITKFNVNSSWVVSQYANQYNPVHWHAGHITGVGYLKVPKTLGEPVQKEVKYVNINGHLQLVHGSRMFLSNSKLNIKPEVGDFYFSLTI